MLSERVSVEKIEISMGLNWICQERNEVSTEDRVSRYLQEED
jgi:hypothetical protein